MEHLMIFFSLNMFTGPNPSITKGTKSYINLTDKKQFTKEITKWDAVIHEQNDDTMTLEVSTKASNFIYA